MNILIGLIPALAWGILPLVVTKIGGKPINQIIGTTFGTLMMALFVWLIMRPEIGLGPFWITFLSGASWALGQFLQYMAFKRVGVSKAMPISTGLQLVGTSLLGVLAFGEWGEGSEKLIGFSALLLIIVGITLTTIKSVKMKAENADHSSVFMTMSIFLVSTLGYVGYSAFPRIANVSGWQGFFPQALGMASMSVLLAMGTIGTKVFKEKTTWFNLLSGVIFSIAALTYLISAQKNGVTTGFTLSQMNVVIATLGGIVILKEHKTKQELIFTFIGLALVIVGGVVIGNMSK
ncbi:GRP family sugar transporter (plasmid) [Enterococcus sp. 22-H-5-01]|uniref:GRP family sugar transporter n=1 Tax=Enterococcus sp. 22-H-5-01 TaxID=3418555 RepID=UPI003D04C268